MPSSSSPDMKLLMIGIAGNPNTKIYPGSSLGPPGFSIPVGLKCKASCIGVTTVIVPAGSAAAALNVKSHLWVAILPNLPMIY